MSNSTNETKRRRNYVSENEENKDRFSDLPDSILILILSLLKPKHAVQTCILSTRWKSLWKHVPTLILLSSDFSTSESFTRFVSTIMNLRDGYTDLHILDFDCVGSVHPYLLKRMVNYAVELHVKQLRINVGCDMQRLLPCIFTCQSLTSLNISLDTQGCINERNLFPKTLNLPALTTLNLRNITFCSSGNFRSDPFSALNRLNSLIIDRCNIKYARTLCISSATLVNLTVRDLRVDICKIELSTPCLDSFSFKGYPDQHPCGGGLFSVQEVNIDVDIRSCSTKTTMILLSLLRDLVNIRSLTVSTNTLQVLSLVPNILKMKMEPLLWANLKTLKIKREPPSYMLTLVKLNATTESPEEAEMLWKTSWQQTAPLPDGIVDFLLQNSPSAEVETID